jgi:hypothetical protein
MSKSEQLLGLMQELENHILDLETISKLIRVSSEAAEKVRDPEADKVMNLLIAADLLLSDQTERIYDNFKEVWENVVTSMPRHHGSKAWITKLEEDPTNSDYYTSIIPDEMLEELGWVEGDELEVKMLDNKTVLVTKFTKN